MTGSFFIPGYRVDRKVYELNELKLVKVGLKLLDFQPAARYFLEILTGCDSCGFLVFEKNKVVFGVSFFN